MLSMPFFNKINTWETFILFMKMFILLEVNDSDTVNCYGKIDNAFL